MIFFLNFSSGLSLTGSCYALSYNTNIDEDNAVALLPNGNNTHLFFSSLIKKEMRTVKKKSNHADV